MTLRSAATAPDLHGRSVHSSRGIVIAFDPMVSRNSVKLDYSDQSAPRIDVELKSDTIVITPYRLSRSNT